MARNIVPASISFTCDCCSCNCNTAPAATTSGMRNGASPDSPNLSQPFSLDLCAECLVDFDAWIAAKKSEHQGP